MIPAIGDTVTYTDAKGHTQPATVTAMAAEGIASLDVDTDGRIVTAEGVPHDDTGKKRPSWCIKD